MSTERYYESGSLNMAIKFNNSIGENKKMNTWELVQRICNCLSDGYDDEKNREETENILYNKLSQISSDSFIKCALVRLCDRIEELEK